MSCHVMLRVAAAAAVAAAGPRPPGTLPALRSVASRSVKFLLAKREDIKLCTARAVVPPCAE